MSKTPEPNYEILYPRGGGPTQRALSTRDALSATMRPASFVYDRGVAGVRALRTRRRRSLGVNAFVVSVGNLEVGGTGKTPLAIHIVRELARRGHRPVYVSRGFKSAAEALDAVTVVVPKSVEPERWVASRLRALREDAEELADAVGDEGAVVAMRCPGVPLAFSRDRRRAIQTVCAMFEPTHVVLDDAFQTWGVPRDADIVLLDAEAPLGNGRLLPAGTLRERPDALARADLIGFNGIRTAGELASRRSWVSGLVGRDLPVFGVLRDLGFFDAFTGAPIADPRGSVASVCGIGRPLRFERLLVGKGLDLRLSLRYPDHFRYGRLDVRRIETLLSERGIGRLVTTEKDWVKLRAGDWALGVLWLARLTLDVVGEDPVSACEKPQASPAVSL